VGRGGEEVWEAVCRNGVVLTVLALPHCHSIGTLSDKNITDVLFRCPCEYFHERLCALLSEVVAIPVVPDPVVITVDTMERMECRLFFLNCG
jgi:hypothetical protein